MDKAIRAQSARLSLLSQQTGSESSLVVLSSVRRATRRKASSYPKGRGDKTNDIHTKEETVNPNPCKICEHGRRGDIEAKILAGAKFREIIVAYPELNNYNISGHKKNHMGIDPESSKSHPPEVDPAEVDKMPEPDVVKLVSWEVNRFEIIKRRRELTPSEERNRARFMEFLLKIALFKLEAKAKDNTVVNTSWVDAELKKVREGIYDVK